MEDNDLEPDDTIEFAPGVLEKLNSAPPEVQEEIRRLLSIMRQAEAGVKSGQYPDLLTGLKALGVNPQPVDEEHDRT